MVRTISRLAILAGLLLFLFAVAFVADQYSRDHGFKNQLGIPMGAEEIESFDVRGETTKLRERIRSIGASAAYEELAEETSALPSIRQHIYGHAFGDALYDEEGIEGMNVCDERFYSGCLHQFTGRAVNEYGSDIVPDLSRACLMNATSHGAFSCAHGVGHGILAWLGYDLQGLTKTLALCREDTSDEEFAFNCRGGAFAEYNTRSFAGEISVRPVPEDKDYYYPCAVLPESERDLCVQMLPHWWMYLLETEVPVEDMVVQMGEWCRALPESLREYNDSCFLGIGVNATRATGFTPEEARTLCTHMAHTSKEESLCQSSAANVSTLFGEERLRREY